jgi:hypothetical protein
MGGSVCSIIEATSCHLPGKTEQNHEKVSQYSRWPGRDSNRAPPHTSLDLYRYTNLLACFAFLLSSLRFSFSPSTIVSTVALFHSFSSSFLSVLHFLFSSFPFSHDFRSVSIFTSLFISSFHWLIDLFIFYFCLPWSRLYSAHITNQHTYKQDGFHT